MNRGGRGAVRVRNTHLAISRDMRRRRPHVDAMERLLRGEQSSLSSWYDPGATLMLVGDYRASNRGLPDRGADGWEHGQ